MIVFVDKETGRIIGKINGRKHPTHVLKNVWIGDKQKTEKIVIEWKRTGKENIIQKIKTELIPLGISQNGEKVYRRVNKAVNIKRKEWEPDFVQKDLISNIERGKENIFNFKYNFKTKKLIKKAIKKN